MDTGGTGNFESTKVIRWLLTMAAFVGLAQGLGLIIRDCSITCNVGFKHAPIAFLILALINAPFVILQVRWIKKWGFLTWQIRSTLVAAISFLVFRLILFLLFKGQEQKFFHISDSTWLWSIRTTYIAFFVWVDLIFAVLTSNLFGLLRQESSGSKTEKYLSWIGAAVYAGGLIGGFFAGEVNDWIRKMIPGRWEYARDHLMIAMSLAIFVLVTLIYLLQRQKAERPTQSIEPAEEEISSGHFTQAWKSIRSDRSLLFLAIGFFSTGIATILLDYLFYWLLSTQGEGDGGFVGTLAKFYIWMNGLSLLMIGLGTGRIIRRFGLAFALLALPIALITSTSYLLIQVALPVIFVIRILEESLWGTLYEPATERLLLRIHPDQYNLLRPILEGMMTRLGIGFGAIMILLLTFGIKISLFWMIGVLVGFHILWIGILLFLLKNLKSSMVPEATA